MVRQVLGQEKMDLAVQASVIGIGLALDNEEWSARAMGQEYGRQE